MATPMLPLLAHDFHVSLGEAGGVIMALSMAGVGLMPFWWLALPGCFGIGLGF